MTSPDYTDPYAGNLLTQGLGKILSREEALGQLTFLPPPPRNIEAVPKHIRMHYLMQLRDFHLATLEGARLRETIDLMVRQSYRYRDPMAAQTWSVIGGESLAHKTPRSPAMAAVAVGHSGTGKTEAILRALNCYPSQVIAHETFPKMASQHYQVVWQSVDVPSSGRAPDLAANLMMNWDLTMSKHVPDWPGRFSAVLAKERRDGSKMLDEWRQVAIGHFLGILHLDEVQNFFRLQSLEKRRKRSDSSGGLELSIVEDQCLKWILTLSNTWQIPLLLSGTPDGVGALTKRLSTIQRFVTCGYHSLPIFENPADLTFYEGFFKQLAKYQYVKNKIPVSPEFASVVLELTGGIHRFIIALWIAAHRVAFERKCDDLRIEDFQRASATYLAPAAAPIAALRSKDPKRMSRYEDLIERDDGYWATFWNSMSAL